MQTAEHHRTALSLRVLGVNVRIVCAEARARALLEAHYGGMRQLADTAYLTYTIDRAGGRWRLAANGAAPLTAADPGELLCLLDQAVIIDVQRRRPDLYFIHAGVLQLAGRAVLLVAPAGGGKSTLVWGLVHHGFRYLSDELAPVDLRTMTVHPYPRALTLKRRPPGPYPLPRGTRWTSRGLHIAPNAGAGEAAPAAAPVAAVLFLQYAPALRPAVEPISTAQAGARLYANALNALAHPQEGLDGALRIAAETAGFHVSTAGLATTCALVSATLAAQEIPHADRHAAGATTALA